MKPNKQNKFIFPKYQLKVLHFRPPYSLYSSSESSLISLFSFLFRSSSNSKFSTKVYLIY